MSDIHAAVAAADASDAAPAEADTFDADFAAARAAEHDETPDDDAPAAAAATPAEPVVKPPLDPETANKRLSDTQAALRAERAQSRAMKAELAALKAGAAPPAAAAEPVAPPDVNTDPIGAIKYLEEKVQVLSGDSPAQKAAKAEQSRRQEAFNLVRDTMADHENDFRGHTPDYDDAAAHFAESRKAELAETGLTGRDLDAALADDLTKVVARAIQTGKDPAEIVYKLAKGRGFGATAAVPATPASNTSAIDDAATRLQTVAKGQEQAKSLGSGGTPPGATAVTWGSVANLKGAAFDAAFDKLRAQERRG